MDVKLLKIQEEEQLTHAPDFWNDPKRAEQILKSIKQKKNWTDAYKQVNTSVDDLAVLFDFAKEGAATEQEFDAAYTHSPQFLEDLDFKNMFIGF